MFRACQRRPDEWLDCEHRDDRQAAAIAQCRIVAQRHADSGQHLTQRGARALPTPERLALGRVQEVHLHFHGVSAEDVAAIIARQDKAGE